MRTLKQKIVRVALSTLFTVPILVSAVAMFAQAPSHPGQPAALKQRVVRPKPARTVINPAKARADVIVLKFREGTRIRERAGLLEADLINLSDAEERLLQRADLPRQRLFQELAWINGAIAPNSNRFVTRLFTRPEDELTAEKLQGEARIGEELADLNLYHYILITDAKPDETERLIDQLNALAVVEIAYPQPITAVGQVDAAPSTPNFTTNQGYLGPASTNGIDVAYARSFPGTRGNDVQIIDVEGGWNLTHEDLPPIFFQAGPNRGDFDFRQHGTAVLGMLAAGENAYGMTGIVPQSRIGVSSGLGRTCILRICWWTDDMANGINRAPTALRVGDIMVIEFHAPGPSSGLTAPCHANTFEWVAMEYWDANFDAIKNATAKGVVVVEIAGNGSMDLDSPIYNGKFNRSIRDSGAIMVGAGSSSGREPLCFTNFGSRVDLQGWGENVATLGYGDIKVNGIDDNQFYTPFFGGTSSATAIVAGSAASLQGFRKARGLSVFTSLRMRDFLRQTGVAQAADAKQIGPLPNLRAAIDAHAVKRNLKVTFLTLKVVDNVFPGPHALSFNFTVNSNVAQYPGGGATASFPQGLAVNLPAGFSLTGQEILDDGLVLQVSTNLKSILTFDPKTGLVTSVISRPVKVLRGFATGTDFGSSTTLLGSGSRTFTHRSTDANGYFEVTYKVEEVKTLLLTR